MVSISINKSHQCNSLLIVISVIVTSIQYYQNLAMSPTLMRIMIMISVTLFIIHCLLISYPLYEIHSILTYLMDLSTYLSLTLFYIHKYLIIGYIAICTILRELPFYRSFIDNNNKTLSWLFLTQQNNKIMFYC